jgi:hypothetical protein
MTTSRLRTPATDGGLLVEPRVPGTAEQVAANAARLAAWDYDFQGRRARVLREQIRREVVGQAHEFLRRHGLESPEPASGGDGLPSKPLIITGHQPELFHPGVWIKNFAAAAIARSSGGLALNLIVDNDIPKSASIRVPVLDRDGLRAVRIEFDRWNAEIPYEDWVVHDEALFTTFADRVRSVLDGLVVDPILGDFWPQAIRLGGETGLLGLRFALARRVVEASWGVSNLEIPVSTLCGTTGFLWCAAHVLAELPRYQDVHNNCLATYRAAHRIRSRHHPVPALGRQGEWLEAPFWVWRRAQPRRRALLVRQRRRELDLRIAGEDEVLMALPLAPDREACCAVERLRDLADSGIRLRTRALTTTMFSRLLLGDLFIHGIGGAKYDQLGDEILRRFFGFDPPAFLTVSLTLWLGLPTQAVTQPELATVGQRLRDLKFNPDRHLAEPIVDDVRNVINAKRAAIAWPVTSRRNRIQRRSAIHRCNGALQLHVEGTRAELEGLRARLRAGARWNRVAANREFAFVLHSAGRLREVLPSVSSAIAGGVESVAGSSCT